MARRSNKNSRVNELKKIASDVGKNPNPIRRTKKISGILIFGLLVVAVVIVFALIFCNALNSCQVNIYAELNGQKLEEGNRYTVNPGDIVIVEAGSSEAKIAFITYYFVTDDSRSEKIKVYDNRAEIEIPQGEPGSLMNLLVEPVAANDDGTPNTVTKTGWQKYTLKYEEKALRVCVNNVTIVNGSINEVKPGTAVDVYAEPAGKVKKIYFCHLGDSKVSIDASSYRFFIPDDLEPGETYTVKLNALFDDGYYIDNKDGSQTSSEVYKFKIK